MICVYGEETFAVHFLETKLNQSIVSVIAFKNQNKCYLISLYRLQSSTPDQFDNFLKPFEELLSDIFKLRKPFALISGGFKYRNSNGYLGDLVTWHGACNWNNFSLKGYKLYHADHLDNCKKGGVCVFCNKTLPVHFLQTKLNQGIASKTIFEKEKKWHLIFL